MFNLNIYFLDIFGVRLAVGNYVCELRESIVKTVPYLNYKKKVHYEVKINFFNWLVISELVKILKNCSQMYYTQFTLLF